MSKEPGELYYELAYAGMCPWAEVSDRARAEFVRVEAAIRADEAAKVRAATIEECAKAIDRDLGEMDSEMRSYAKYFASNVRALRTKGAEHG